jgi:hypothetical protein
MRWLLIKFDETRCFGIGFVFDRASLVELEESSRIDLA